MPGSERPRRARTPGERRGGGRRPPVERLRSWSVLIVPTLAVWLLVEGLAGTGAATGPRAPIPPPTAPALPEVLGVELRVLPPTGDHRFRVESAGLLAALVERALFDHPRLLPRFVDAPPRPSAAYVPAPERSWGVDLDLDRRDVGLTARITICAPEGGCAIERRRADDGQEPALARWASDLVVTAALGDDAPATTDGDAAAAAPSADPYAQLLIGRAAAAAIGLGPSPEPGSNDDPARRALRVDASAFLAASLLSRSVEAPEDRRALLDGPPAQHPSDLADRAAARFAAGRYAAAWRAWQAFDDRQPGDPRFLLARAASAAAAGRREVALELLDRGGTGLTLSPWAVMVEGGLALAEDGPGPALLRRWQANLPLDPIPVRLQLERTLSAGDFEAALPLAEALSSRGAPREARRLIVAVAAELGQVEVARKAARELGQDEVARRLAAAADPTPNRLRSATSPEARLRQAEQWLDGFQAERALETVRALLLQDPWWPEALDLERRACLALGREREARLVEQRVRFADPLFYAEAGKRR